MTPRRNSVEGLIEALQSDLPTGADEARVRVKLVGAGVLASGVLSGASAGAATASSATLGAATAGSATLGAATAGSATLGAAAVSGGTSGTLASVAGQVGLWSQFVALPVVAKVGAATTLLAAVASVGVSYTAVSDTSVSNTSASVTSVPDTRASQKPPTSAGPSPGSQGAMRAVEAATELPQSAPKAPSLAPRPKEREVTQALPAAEANKSALRATTLAQETPLIERAMLAIQAGDSVRARYWLDEHARLFPQGLLARERSLAASRIPVEQP